MFINVNETRPLFEAEVVFPHDFQFVMEIINSIAYDDWRSKYS